MLLRIVVAMVLHIKSIFNLTFGANFRHSANNKV